MSRILVVDDEPLIQKMVGNTLRESFKVLVVGSGEEAIEICDKELPDLILSDLYMPVMDGFQMYTAIKEKHGADTPPVIFMTGKEDASTEGRGFELGASDFIYKPFYKDILIHRIENVLKNHEHIQDLTKEATTDGLTGFLNKINVSETLSDICERESGALLIIDLDSFKLVNDMFGHDKGDLILSEFADLIRQYTRSEDITGRIGGDEFVAFLKGVKDERPVSEFTTRINEQLVIKTKAILGETMKIPIGASIGTVFVPLHGTNFNDLFHMADKALYAVKLNGKHGYAIYNDNNVNAASTTPEEDMKMLSRIFEERHTANCALWVGQEAFSYIYRYMLRFIQSYHGVAYKVLFTVTPKEEDISSELFTKIVEAMGGILKNSLRKSDIMMQSKANQFFLFLPEITEEYIDGVIWRTIGVWEKNEYSKYVDVDYEAEIVSAEDEKDDRRSS
jgi:diguanylate cyclase (GGDEF)-like protein